MQVGRGLRKGEGVQVVVVFHEESAQRKADAALVFDLRRKPREGQGDRHENPAVGIRQRPGHVVGLRRVHEVPRPGRPVSFDLNGQCPRGDLDVDVVDGGPPRQRHVHDVHTDGRVAVGRQLAVEAPVVPVVVSRVSEAVAVAFKEAGPPSLPVFLHDSTDDHLRLRENRALQRNVFVDFVVEEPTIHHGPQRRRRRRGAVFFVFFGSPTTTFLDAEDPEGAFAFDAEGQFRCRFSCAALAAATETMGVLAAGVDGEGEPYGEDDVVLRLEPCVALGELCVLSFGAGDFSVLDSTSRPFVESSFELLSLVGLAEGPQSVVAFLLLLVESSLAVLGGDLPSKGRRVAHGIVRRHVVRGVGLRRAEGAGQHVADVAPEFRRGPAGLAAEDEGVTANFLLVEDGVAKLLVDDVAKFRRIRHRRRVHRPASQLLTLQKAPVVDLP
mmetsp:Transcript_6938/g.22565  ORF Transcript_6938/g.22565 Transcript_6938/m.22565 type:complete len:441 (+) Transcript_6938:2329-3651(+)